MQQPTPSESTQALLARLSQRPGVQSTLILSRDTGAIVRSSGLVTAEELAEDGTAPTTTTTTTTTTMTAVNGENSTNGEVAKKKGTRQAEEVAGLVWNFMKASGAMVEELNGEGDESKLVRVRTKRNELVVVPGRLSHDGMGGPWMLIGMVRRCKVPACCDS